MLPFYQKNFALLMNIKNEKCFSSIVGHLLPQYSAAKANQNKFDIYALHIWSPHQSLGFKEAHSFESFYWPLILEYVGEYHSSESNAMVWNPYMTYHSNGIPIPSLLRCNLHNVFIHITINKATWWNHFHISPGTKTHTHTHDHVRLYLCIHTVTHRWAQSQIKWNPRCQRKPTNGVHINVSSDQLDYLLKINYN